METDPRASQLAARFRYPIAAIGVASFLVAIANLFLHVVDDRIIGAAAAVVSFAAAGMFACAVLDGRFQRALSALNGERRTRARQRGLLSGLTSWGLPSGDRLLVTVGVPLLVMGLVAANDFHDGAVTALLFSAFALVGLAQMALMVRRQPTDRWVDPFH